MMSGDPLGILRRFQAKKVQFFFEILTLVEHFRDSSYSEEDEVIILSNCVTLLSKFLHWGLWNYHVNVKINLKHQKYQTTFEF